MSNRVCSVLFCGLLCVFVSRSGIVGAQATHSAVPEKTLPQGKYLIYLHGKILEDQGTLRAKSERFGFYEYQAIVEAFRNN